MTLTLLNLPRWCVSSSFQIYGITTQEIEGKFGYINAIENTQVNWLNTLKNVICNYCDFLVLAVLHKGPPLGISEFYGHKLLSYKHFKVDGFSVVQWSMKHKAGKP